MFARPPQAASCHSHQESDLLSLHFCNAAMPSFHAGLWSGCGARGACGCVGRAGSSQQGQTAKPPGPHGLGPGPGGPVANSPITESTESTPTESNESTESTESNESTVPTESREPTAARANGPSALALRPCWPVLLLRFRFAGRGRAGGRRVGPTVTAAC